MRQITSFLVALLVIFVSSVAASPISEEGFAVGAATAITVSGSVFDSASGAPVAAAQVTILSDRATERATSGPDGAFSVTLSSAESFGTLSIEVSAYGYQQKYIESLVRDTFRNRVDAEVFASTVKVKSKKVDASLACGETAPIEIRTGGTAPVGFVCGDGLAGMELTVRKNRIAVLAAPPYAMRIESGRVELQKITGGRVEIRISAAMLPR